ncbi:MAG: class I SAM-dependent methyltransferase [Candidatus Cyclobacteriaceae bacterium M3_2C_046]
MKTEIYQTGEYLKNNSSWHIEDSPWKAGNVMKMIKRNNLEAQTICEVGCGAGEILRQLSYELPSSTDFYGYEISPQAYYMAEERSGEQLQFYLKDLFQEPEDVRYDLLMAIDVFEHVEDYFTFLKNMKDRGTYKLFHIPLDININAIIQDKFMVGRKTVGHIHYFTKETALASLKETGYEIIDHFFTADSLELPRKTMKSKIAKLPRKIMFKFNPDFTVKLMGGFSLMVLTK